MECFKRVENVQIEKIAYFRKKFYSVEACFRVKPAKKKILLWVSRVKHVLKILTTWLMARNSKAKSPTLTG